jgi:hypothetical protein
VPGISALTSRGIIHTIDTMKRSHLHLVAVLLLGMNTSAQEVSSGPQSATISSPEPIYNFGTVTNKPSISHTFVLKNTGTSELVISKVKPSCGCTTANLSKNTLQPGEEVEVSATLSLKGRKGKQRKTITVLSNDRTTPRFALQLVGNVHQVVNVLPSQAVFNIKPGTATSSRDVYLRFDSPQLVNVTGIETNGAACCSAVLSEETPSKNFKVAITIRQDFMPMSARTSAHINVLTDLPTHPVIRVPIQIRVQRDIVFAPPQLNLMPSTAASTQKLIVRERRGRPIDIIDLKSPFGKISYNAVKMSASMYRLDIRLESADPSMNGKFLSLHVKDASGKVQVLPVPIRVSAVISG